MTLHTSAPEFQYAVVRPNHDRSKTMIHKTHASQPVSRARLLTALRLLPATMLLAGALSFAPGLATDAGATGCHVAPSNVSINGGVSRNATTLNLSANGGTATSNAQGGDDNLAIGILGNANAGNGGTADARANGGRITLGDV